MKFRQIFAPKYFPHHIGGAVLAISIIRVMFFYLGPDERLIGVIADDAFYYIQLARHRFAEGFWTFDGSAPATGFHFLYGYFLFGVLTLSPDLDWRALYLAVGCVASVAIAMAAFISAATIKNLFGSSIAIWGAVPFLTMPMLLQSTSMMESWMVVLSSAVTLYGVAHSRAIHFWTWIALFTLGLVGSLARTDYGLLPAMLTIASLALQRGRLSHVAIRSLAVLLGAMVGLAIVMLHSYALASHFTQASALIKFHWSAVEGHSFGPIMWLITHVVVPANIGPLAYLGFWVIAVTLTFIALTRSIAAPPRERTSVPTILFAGCVLTIIGYIHFYRYNSAAIQLWYAAHLVAPLALCLAAVAHHFLKEKFVALGAGLFMLCATLALMQLTYIPYAHQAGMMHAGLFIKDQPEGPRYGAWNAGIISYFSQKAVINVDGLTNDEVLPFIQSNRLFDYFKLRHIDFLVDYEVMLQNPTARQRGGYINDPRIDQCIAPLFALDTGQPQWSDSSLKLFSIEPDCR